MALLKLKFDKKRVLCYTARMVDQVALRDAWHDYWQHPEWSVKHVAEVHGIRPQSFFTLLRRAGHIARRTTSGVKPIRLDASHCPGYQVAFCAQCPCPPRCTEWACHECRARFECACCAECLRPRAWQEQFDAYMRERQRNRRALRLYRYAWSSPDEPLEEV